MAARSVVGNLATFHRMLTQVVVYVCILYTTQQQWMMCARVPGISLESRPQKVGQDFVATCRWQPKPRFPFTFFQSRMMVKSCSAVDQRRTDERRRRIIRSTIFSINTADADVFHNGPDEKKKTCSTYYLIIVSCTYHKIYVKQNLKSINCYNFNGLCIRH